MDFFGAKFNSEQLLFETFFGAMRPLQTEINICAHELFWTKFNSEQLLFEAFFDAIRIFGSVEP